MMYTKQKGQTNMIVRFLFALAIILGLMSCNSPSQGFVLQNFEVSNPKLDSIVNLMTKVYKNKDDKKDIIVLDLQTVDSIPQFWFSLHTKNELRDFYIFNQNRRIVGYLTNNKSRLILLTNINDKCQFEELFCKFIRPSEKKERFDFIYFPDNQYKTEREVTMPNGDTDTISTWPDIPGFHDCMHIQFKLLNNEFVNSGTLSM